MRPTDNWFIRPGGLASRLETLRRAARLRQERLAAELRWPRTKISKIENGKQLPTEEDVHAWARVCDAEDQVPQLLALLQETRAVHRQFRHSMRRGLAALQADIGQMVRDATAIACFEMILIPGLVQTTDYARYRMLEAVRVYGADPDQVDAGVAGRIRNQEVLYDTGKQFRFLMMEAALTARVCPGPVMIGQLDRLVQLSALPNVQFGVITADTELQVTPLNSFWQLDDITYIETFASEIVLRGEEAQAYQPMAEGLWQQAATGHEARDVIARAAATLRG